MCVCLCAGVRLCVCVRACACVRAANSRRMKNAHLLDHYSEKVIPRQSSSFQDLYAPAIMTNSEWHGRLDTRVQKLIIALRDGLAASLKGGEVTKEGAAKNEKDAHAIVNPKEEIDFWAYQAAALKGDPQERAKR